MRSVQVVEVQKQSVPESQARGVGKKFKCNCVLGFEVLWSSPGCWASLETACTRGYQQLVENHMQSFMASCEASKPSGYDAGR